VAGTLLLTIFTLTACNGSSDEETPLLNVGSQGKTSINQGTLASLLKGSRKHLRPFDKQIKTNGGVYCVFRLIKILIY
jgi:hypothetical protein